MDTETFARQCRHEVHDLHDFFAAWYRGEHSRDDFDRVERAIADEFAIVTPEGERIEREPLLAGIREGHGERTGMGPERDAGAGDGGQFTIDARQIAVADLTDKRCLLTYEEHHRGPVESARASAAYFRPSGTAPNGVAWLFVQETWLPDGAPDSEG